MTKWIFVTGGVLSGLGKGLISASASKLLQLRGQKPMPIKCDGYLNVDPGTMNPHEHGEVFVLKDGTEVDMDFGHYERFLGVKGRGNWNLTSGKIFQEVIEKERRGDFLGKTVQMVPHVTDEIKNNWKEEAREADTDVAVVEIGGTVGDIENMLYLEAVRQMRGELPEEDSYHIHATLVPFLKTTGEQKTKPTQHSVKKLREMGLEPNMIVARSEEELDKSAKEKIALFCDVGEEEVISEPDLDSVYRIPLVFDEQDVDELIAEKMDLPERKEDMEDWKRRVENLRNGDRSKILICGKYTEMDDSYVSVEEALKHAAAEYGGSVKIEYLDSENASESLPEEKLKSADGVVIPGGFGKRGVGGKMEVIRWCRENDKPILGLCYGMQLMVIEFARNMCGIDASSEEWEEKGVNVIAEMPEQKNIEEMGGTMRLGEYRAEVEGKVAEIYGQEEVTERHRHRFEVNPKFHRELESEGLRISGKNGKLAEFIELDNHKLFIGTQAHPEFNSSLEDPNPLYLGFMEKTR